MPRYYLHLRYRKGADGLAVDREGDELPDLDALQRHAEATARDLMRTARLEAVRDWTKCSFEVTDEDGALVKVMPFSSLARRR